ncbi:hypothetical protein Shyhy01_66470 [Streptomyces hygroscopicus subsp. hygroscopicus]|nr:hypothetical protein [Streptomyces hygroscopicus]GLX53698.1 hypothetical protein Shyhy01_66470 [Streptomyces hygroscopicus subsp. hygroscopicus]
MSPRAGRTGHPARTLAFVESPVQLLNVLEWAHLHGLRDPDPGPAGGAGAGADPLPPVGLLPPAGPLPSVPAQVRRTPAGGTAVADGGAPAGGASADGGVSPTGGAPSADGGSPPGGASPTGGTPPVGGDLTVVVLSPTDPMTRGQLRRMADLARDEGYRVRWEEARGGPTAPFATIGGLAGLLRRADRVVMGDPFSRYVQLLLTITRARDLVVVDDGTATMEFVAQLARGERLVRWHRKGGRPGPRDLLFAPVSFSARRRLTPSAHRRVEVFSSMPVHEIPEGVTVTANDFSWTRARFGPPRITKGADMVGTSLVETGVVDGDSYLEAVRTLAKAHGTTRYFAHRRESTEKLHRLATETGLEIVRPDLPLELIARRGPIGRTILSFPSTVVHTLPLALAGTGVRVAVCDIDPTWLTENASPRAQGFLSGVTGTARDVHRLASVSLA